MTKRLLAGVAAAVLMSSVAFAQSGPGSSTTTTKQGTDSHRERRDQEGHLQGGYVRQHRHSLEDND